MITKPIISPDFTIEDIHKIREQNYERTKDSRLYLAKISLKTRNLLDFSLKYNSRVLLFFQFDLSMKPFFYHFLFQLIQFFHFILQMTQPLSRDKSGL